MSATPLHTPDIVERLRGPHEWGYRCIAEGAFIEDRTPFEAAEYIERLEAELARRDANENRNCLNWGPCSRHDGRMDDAAVAEARGEA